jgi:hypothetical protein
VTNQINELFAKALGINRALKRDPEPIEMPIANAAADWQVGKVSHCVLHR